MEIPNNVDSKFVETPSVKEVLLFANTPSFLISRLRKDGATSYLVQVLSTEESIGLLRKLEHPQDITELLWAYVLMASFFLRDDIIGFQSDINALDLSQIQWGTEIRRDLLSEITPTNFHKVEYAEGTTLNAENAATVRGQGISVATNEENLEVVR
jgi:hypothetical protein